TQTLVQPATPATVGLGRHVTVTVQVTNAGLLSATSVNVVLTPTAGLLQPISAPAPLALLPQNGGTAVFTFIYSGLAQGLVSFSAQAFGTDYDGARESAVQ